MVGVAQAVGDRVPLGKDPLAGSYRHGELPERDAFSRHSTRSARSARRGKGERRSANVAYREVGAVDQRRQMCSRRPRMSTDAE